MVNNNIWRSPVRKIKASVELNNGSTQAIYKHTDNLKGFTIERVGENSKFFGFGICQKANIHLIDTTRVLEFSTEYKCKCYIGCENEIDPFPGFKITEVHRDENTGELSITAYDALYWATNYTYADLAIAAPYSIEEVAAACANILGLNGYQIIGIPTENNPFNIVYENGANLEGTETVRELLNAIAEATQTIYYIDSYNNLIFKRIDKDGAEVLVIDKANYFSLDSKTNRRLSDICSATELGDNITTTTGIIGTVQYIRDNPFLELREDITTLLDNAIAAVGGLTINQFDCTWRGNPTISIGDKIALTTKDDNIVYSYVFDDVIEYSGGLTQKTKWNYAENVGESANNPTSIGEALKKTFARVDKAKAEIEIVAGETSAIKLTTDGIQSTVTKLDNDMSNIKTEVNSKISAEDIEFIINSTLEEEGVNKITTSTGFTFNEEGLHVSKTGAEVETTITEDGMRVRRNKEEVLVADNLGVKAEDLHATTFLIIGSNSRLENYNSNRTGCFWIGK